MLGQILGCAAAVHCMRAHHCWQGMQGAGGRSAVAATVSSAECRCPCRFTTPVYSEMDTNGDGKVDATDDPYAPYYPGHLVLLRFRVLGFQELPNPLPPTLTHPTIVCLSWSAWVLNTGCLC